MCQSKSEETNLEKFYVPIDFGPMPNQYERNEA